MGEVRRYAFSYMLDMPFEKGISKVTEALEAEGFGIITEIDVKATLKKKLDKEFRKYMILGACNPAYAYRSLMANLDVGLLLPCNVIVYEIDEGKTFVSAINPVSALDVIQSKELRAIAEEVSGKLKDFIQMLAKS
jgi:uncharacterized protein (DUF302 family)